MHCHGVPTDASINFGRIATVTIVVEFYYQKPPPASTQLGSGTYARTCTYVALERML